MAETPERRARRRGWARFSAVGLLTMGLIQLHDGFLLFKIFEDEEESEYLTDRLLFFKDDLDVWAWIWLLTAVLLLAAAVAVWMNLDSLKEEIRWFATAAVMLVIVSGVGLGSVGTASSALNIFVGFVLLYALAGPAAPELDETPAQPSQVAPPPPPAPTDPA